MTSIKQIFGLSVESYYDKETDSTTWMIFDNAHCDGAMVAIGNCTGFNQASQVREAVLKAMDKIIRSH